MRAERRGIIAYRLFRVPLPRWLLLWLLWLRMWPVVVRGGGGMAHKVR